MLSDLPLAHIPPGLHVYAALYKDLRNAKYLRDQLVAGNPQFEYAFIDASMVLSSAHALAAVFRAVTDSTQARLKTRNVHSETVLAMSPNNNVGEAFRGFGISNQTRSLLVIKICPESEAVVAAHLQSAVKATLVEFDDGSLAALADVEKIKKAYKLNDTPTNKETSHEGRKSSTCSTTAERHDLEMSILGMLALRGAN